MAENGTSSSPDGALIHAMEYPNRATIYMAIIIAFTVLLSGFKRGRTQKLAPGVMVVGGSGKQTIRANRERFRENAKEMLEEGYRKVRGGNMTPTAALQRTDQPTNQPQSDNGFFYVPSPLGERLMIPVKYLEELKTAPIDEVDFVATFIEVRL